ncbi:hypothetical protein Ancab_015296 [Ancistrocladus abbreviatus]
MTQDQIFEPRWDFRRQDNNMDSSSNDSGFNSRSESKLKKHKVVDGFISAENEASTGHPSKENETGFERANEEENQAPEEHILGDNGVHGHASSKAKVNRKTRSSYEYDSAAGLHSLQTYMGSLLEELKVAKEDMFKWMGKEMGKLATNEDPPPKPTRRRKVPGQERKLQPTEKRRRTVVRIRNPKNGSSEKSAKEKKKENAEKSDKVAGEQAVGGGEAGGSLASSTTALTANMPAKISVTTPVASVEKERVRPPGFSIKKPRFSPGQSDNVSASNYLTLPSILPPGQAEKTTLNYPSSFSNIQIPSPAASNVDRNKTIPSSMIDLSPCPGYFPGVQQEGRVLTQSGLGNMGYFDQNRNPLISTGSGFPFSLHRGLTGAFGVSNSNRLAGFEYISQSNTTPSMRMNGRGMRFSGGSRGFSRQQGDKKPFEVQKTDGGLTTFRTP